MLDLIVRGGKLVSATGIQQTDIGVEAGIIVALQAELSEPATAEIDARGLHIFPGLIDSHVHFNEPGRADWEGIRTGSSALAAGGGTLFADMPLNSDPPLLTATDFHAKLSAANAAAVTDFAFWGGLTPANLEHLGELAQLGVIGFKAFMSNSGIAEFAAADDLTLYKGMSLAAELGVPVAVHAESEALTSALTEQLRNAGGTSVKDYLTTRPVLAELEAISRALLFAAETGCDLHIVHISTARGVQLVSTAKARGVRVTAETCPHYLHFNTEDLEQLGSILKCAPPLRNEQERVALWQALVAGEFDTVGSDHSPAPPSLKQSTDFFEVWGGIAGVQSSLQVLLSGAKENGLPLEAVARLSSSQPAARFGFKRKGHVTSGFDADFCLVDLASSETLEPEQLFYNHKLSPYLGQTLQGTIKQTLLRGQIIFQNGSIISQQGRLVRPERTE